MGAQPGVGVSQRAAPRGEGVTLPLRVGVIAPEVPGLPALKWGQEMAALKEIDGVEVDYVSGPDVREAAVAAALRSPRDVLIWSGHGTRNGLIVSNGRLLKGRWVASQVRAGAPRAMLVAACGSACSTAENENLIWYISKAGINVIGFPDEVPDHVAVLYSTEFVRSLRAGADVGEAHDVAVEAVEDGYEQAGQILLLPGLTNGYRFIIERINAQDARLKKLEDGQTRMLDLLERSLATGKP